METVLLLIHVIVMLAILFTQIAVYFYKLLRHQQPPLQLQQYSHRRQLQISFSQLQRILIQVQVQQNSSQQHRRPQQKKQQLSLQIRPQQRTEIFKQALPSFRRFLQSPVRYKPQPR